MYRVVAHYPGLKDLAEFCKDVLNLKFFESFPDNQYFRLGYSEFFFTSQRMLKGETKSTSNRLKSESNKKGHYVNVLDKDGMNAENVIDARKLVSSSIANVTHSSDAFVICRTSEILSSKSIAHILIHDCLCSDKKHTAEVNIAYQTAVIELLEKDYILELLINNFIITTYHMEMSEDDLKDQTKIVIASVRFVKRIKVQRNLIISKIKNGIYNNCKYALKPETRGIDFLKFPKNRFYYGP
jgi:hypothetical protein